MIEAEFHKLIRLLDRRIIALVNRFDIPEWDFEDVYQECLYVLRFGAMKERTDWHNVRFYRFALLRMRRHLASIMKVQGV